MGDRGDHDVLTPSSFGPTPYFCLHRQGWIPCVVSWDRVTGHFTRTEGPDAFTAWHEAEEASRFLRPPVWQVNTDG